MSSEIKWSDILDSDRWAIKESNLDNINILYEIYPNCRRTDQDPDGFIIGRTSLDDKFNDGILGYFNNEVGICCGFCRFSAMGLPLDGKCNGDIEYVKKFAEIDSINLKNEKDNVFVSKFMKKNGNK